MRKLLVLTTFILLFFSQVFSVSAQTVTPSATPFRTPKGEGIRQEVKLRVAEQRTEKSEALEERRQEKIKSFFERMMSRFEAAIERLQKLIDRIQARIDKIKAGDPDADVEAQQSQLDNAKDKLNDAKNKIQDLKNDFDDLLTSDDPKTVFKTVGKNVRDLKKDLVEIHKILVHIIGDIKGLRVGEGTPKPSPTATP